MSCLCTMCRVTGVWSTKMKIYKIKISDEETKMANMVLQLCDKADNIQINRLRVWGQSKREYSVIPEVIYLFVIFS